MPADLGLVANPAECGARELPAHGPGDRAPERGLADARRPDEAQDRRRRLGRELAHGQELEDAILHLVEAVVVFVEDLACRWQLELVLAVRAPGQVRDPLEIVPQQMAIRRMRGQGGQAS